MTGDTHYATAPNQITPLPAGVLDDAFDFETPDCKTLPEYLAFVAARFHMPGQRINAGASCPQCYGPCGVCEHVEEATFAEICAAIGINQTPVDVQRGLTRVV